MNKRIAIVLSLMAVLFVFTGISQAKSERWRDPVTGIWYDGRDPNDKTFHPEDVMPPMDTTPVRFQVSSNPDGTYNLFMRFKNQSGYTWTPDSCTLVCRRGMDFLNNGENGWTIEDVTPKGVEYRTNITLNNYEYGKRMAFAIKCGNAYGGGFWIRL